MNVVVLLAPGFEELETVTIVDVLRRAGISVLLAGIAPSPIEGGHAVSYTHLTLPTTPYV